MHPKIHSQSNASTIVANHEDYDNIIKTISTFECSHFFKTHLAKDQSEQKKIVTRFQNELFKKLQLNIPDIKWEAEYKPNQINRDSIDIHGNAGNYSIVIEIDKHRADQVAKKFLSRTAILEKDLIYIALCIPGTSRMNPKECIKYFEYCKILSERINNLFVGFIVE